MEVDWISLSPPLQFEQLQLVDRGTSEAGSLNQTRPLRLRACAPPFRECCAWSPSWRGPRLTPSRCICPGGRSFCRKDQSLHAATSTDICLKLRPQSSLASP